MVRSVPFALTVRQEEDGLDGKQYQCDWVRDVKVFWCSLWLTDGEMRPAGVYSTIYSMCGPVVCMKFCSDRTEECKLFRRQLSFVVRMVTAWLALIAVSRCNILLPLHPTPFYIHRIHWHLLNRQPGGKWCVPKRHWYLQAKCSFTDKISDFRIILPFYTSQKTRNVQK